MKTGGGVCRNDEYYRRFGGGLGFGLGVPVVSYAPRPMFMEAMSSLRIIGNVSSRKGSEGLTERVDWRSRRTSDGWRRAACLWLLSRPRRRLIDSGQPVRRRSDQRRALECS